MKPADKARNGMVMQFTPSGKTAVLSCTSHEVKGIESMMKMMA